MIHRLDSGLIVKPDRDFAEDTHVEFSTQVVPTRHVLVWNPNAGRTDDRSD